MQKSSIKWQTKSNNILERSFTTTKLASFQGCRGGSTYANPLMQYSTSIEVKTKIT
jgi:hypothetical protein